MKVITSLPSLAAFTRRVHIPFALCLAAPMVTPMSVSSILHSTTLITAYLFNFIMVFLLNCVFLG